MSASGYAHVRGGFPEQTVILEYAVDKTLQADVRSWAKEWMDLALDWDWDLDKPTAVYRDKLQNLTDRVVRAGIGGNRPNRSALIRIRTNESVDSFEWCLREFRIGPKSSTAACSPSNGTCVPVPDTVKQTPRAIRNGTTLLGNYINANAQAILEDRHNVPATYSGFTFLGGQAINPGFSDDIQSFWRAPNIQGDGKMMSLLRHKFSLSTCNGCHSEETGTHFAHIQSREWDFEAELSKFMTGVLAPDPVTGELREFNEFARREEDMYQLLTESSTATMMFQPTTRVHTRPKFPRERSRGRKSRSPGRPPDEGSASSFGYPRDLLGFFGPVEPREPPLRSGAARPPAAERVLPVPHPEKGREDSRLAVVEPTHHMGCIAARKKMTPDIQLVHSTTSSAEHAEP